MVKKLVSCPKIMFPRNITVTTLQLNVTKNADTGDSLHKTSPPISDCSGFPNTFISNVRCTSLWELAVAIETRTYYNVSIDTNLQFALESGNQHTL